jgi:hypothetical protein
MINKQGIKKTAFLLILIGLVVGLLQAYAVAQQKSTFIIYVRGNKKDLGGVDQKYVNVEEFFEYFGVPAESIEEGRSVKIGHLFYNKSIRPVAGKAYTDGVALFNFFGLPYTQANNWTYRLNISSIPMFNRTLHKFQEKVSVTVENRTRTVTALNINNAVYLPVEPLNEIITGRYATDANGRLTFEGKQIDRWINTAGNTYVLADDLRKVIGKPLEVKF